MTVHEDNLGPGIDRGDVWGLFGPAMHRRALRSGATGSLQVSNRAVASSRIALCAHRGPGPCPAPRQDNEGVFGIRTEDDLSDLHPLRSICNACAPRTDALQYAMDDYNFWTQPRSFGEVLQAPASTMRQ